ncbi:hypothetical protein A134_06055 [Vibrio crassostreae 9CS106]|nr:hypothetical protein A134_06055 [Vibrio crassostreae 9CS106]
MTSKLTYASTDQLLRAYPVCIIKDMLKDDSVSDVVQTIMSQNSLVNLHCGNDRDDADLKLNAKMMLDVEKQVQHIAEHGTGVRDTEFPELTKFDNFLRVLRDVYDNLTDSSELRQCRYLRVAKFKEAYPLEAEIAERLRPDTVGSYAMYLDLAQQGNFVNITRKSCCTVEEQESVLASIEAINQKFFNISQQFIEEYNPDFGGSVAQDLFPHLSVYFTELAKALSKACLQDESVLLHKEAENG